MPLPKKLTVVQNSKNFKATLVACLQKGLLMSNSASPTVWSAWKTAS